MPRDRDYKKAEDICRGGRSYGCRHDDHPRATKHPDIFCFRCEDRMGCFLCVESARELVCLNCNNWATRIAERVHGPMVGTFELRQRKLNDAIGAAKTGG